MKKLLAILMALAMMLSMSTMAVAEGTTDITLWTFPIGGWGDTATVDAIIADFQAANPGINVTVEYLDYTNGDAQVTTAIEAGTTPDIIMEGPERLVANWGAAGKMLDISDLWTEENLADINATSASIAPACSNNEGVYYMYPLCMTTHCMVIDKAAFEAADAMQYIDQETHTWTTEGFEKALRALVANGNTVTGLVYCGSQGGDQGTRALVNNLYSGKFTNEDHTLYTADSEANIKALESLQAWANEGIIGFDASIAGGDEIALFCNGTAKMAFCWNAAQYSNASNLETMQANGVEPFPMAFPSDDGVPELCGGIWGFGVFNNGDDAKAEAAKKFIQYVCDDATAGPASVYASGYFPVRASFGDLYTGTDKASNADYAIFMPYLGDIYQVAPNWTAQRAEWWNLLQRVGAGGNVADEVAVYTANSNVQ